MKKGKFSKINKRAGGNKAVQVGYFQKINKLCSTFIRQTRVHKVVSTKGHFDDSLAVSTSFPFRGRTDSKAQMIWIFINTNQELNISTYLVFLKQVKLEAWVPIQSQPLTIKQLLNNY